MSFVIDPLIPLIVSVAFSVFVLNFILRLFKIPSVVVYIIAGIILGPYFLGSLENSSTISLLADLGVTLLLFFIGMELSLSKLLKNWRVSFIGTFLQVIVSILVIFGVGYYLDWPLARIVLLGFVISLSSTAVILKILESNNELNSKRAQNVLGILVVQDIIAIPMIIILSLFSPTEFQISNLIIQIIGMILILALVAYIAKKKEIKIKFLSKVKNDPELQIFTALGICFGFAYLTSLLGLSAALGSFVAGILIASAKETKWVHKSLSPFYVVLVAIFFLSVGVMIDIPFIIENWLLIVGLTLVSFVINIVTGYLVLRFLKIEKKDSFYISLLLSHIGEFSYVLASIGLTNLIITVFGYNLIISMISLSLIISPLLIILYNKFILGLRSD